MAISKAEMMSELAAVFRADAVVVVIGNDDGGGGGGGDVVHFHGIIKIGVF